MLQGTNISNLVQTNKASGAPEIIPQKLSVATELEQLLLNSHEEWEIFQQLDPEHGEEFLVFLPKSLKPEYSGMEKLRALDFATDGSLGQTTLSKAFERPKRGGNIQAFFRLFTPTPQLDKLFYTAGHGNDSSVAALNHQDYKAYLDFLEQQLCKGLIISSCYSGGETSLLAMPKKNEKEVASFDDDPKNHTFTTLVRSIGDFPTLSYQEAEENLGEFYDNVSAFLESSTPKTLAHFRHVLEKVEKEKTKADINLVKIYFPHSKGTSGGFRSVGEHGKGFALTYHLLKRRELESKKIQGLTEPNKLQVIEVENKSLVEVHPLVTELPLVFKGPPPVLLSMIPGDAHHTIKSIAVEEGSSEQFINKTIDFHKNNFISASKGFFVGSITSTDQQYHEVALYISPDRCHCVYRQGDAYFLSDGTTTRSITPFQHALAVREIAAATTPDEQAIRSSSAGQESEKDFLESLDGEIFWSAAPYSESELEYRNLASQLDRLISEGEITETYNAWNLTQEDKQSLVFYLLSEEYLKEAIDIFLKENMDPNMTNFNGTPILTLALTSDHSGFFNHLLINGANPNAKDPANNGFSLLHYAVMENKEVELHLLLNHPNIDIDIRDNDGRPPVVYAADRFDVLNLLCARNAPLNSIIETQEGKIAEQKITPLGLMVSLRENNSIRNLLRHKAADPNAGTPSALVLGFYNNDAEIIKLLLKAGGKPFRQTVNGVVPFNEALMWSSPEIVNLLLKRYGVRLDIEDGNGISPLFAALFSGNKKIIKQMMKRKAPIPQVISKNNQELLEIYIKRCLIAGEHASIKQLLKWNDSQSEAFNYVIGKYLFEQAPELLVKYMGSGLINPIVKSQDGTSLLDEILNQTEPPSQKDVNEED
jgi:ankyrin repeat protein